MDIIKKLKILYEIINRRFEEQFGFALEETTFNKVVMYLHLPKDSSSLAVTRILFGVCMLLDIPEERGGAGMARRWGNPNTCHFPLVPFIRAASMPYMAGVYAALWIGAAGITLGYKYRVSCLLFVVCYWYLILIEKSFWNNHSYLFGLVGILMTFTQANCYWSIDAYLTPSIEKATVPYWNYFILKYQFFILYFMAGMKKGTAEWLTGYSVQKLSEHWVFEPFRWFLSVPQTDYLVVHWFVFVFDLTVALWMMMSSTRNLAMIFCALFHLMNSRLFRIGMFPWVCLATMPLFYPFDWPKTLLNLIKENYFNIKRRIFNFAHSNSGISLCRANNSDIIKTDDEEGNVDESIDEIHENESDIDHNGDNDQNIDKQMELMAANDIADKNSFTECDKNIDGKVRNKNESGIVKSIERTSMKPDNVDLRQKITTYVIIIYVLTQAFLPFSHFITKGYNNWTNGLYGYSWDMMVHTWETNAVVVKLVDNDRNKEYYIDPSHYTLNDRWTRHGDMVFQYAHCLKDRILENNKKSIGPKISDNLSIYIDVWCSMNSRFTQRLFDPKVDLLKVSWSPFEKVPFLLPLLDEAMDWRETLSQITEEVHSWNEHSDVIFFADYPGYDHHKYIPVELGNVSVTVLQGTVVLEPEVTRLHRGHSHKLTRGNRTMVDSGLFHRILNIGNDSAFYMYTFVNNTEMTMELNSVDTDKKDVKPKLPIVVEFSNKVQNTVMFAKLVLKNLFQLTFTVFACQ